MGVTTKHPEYDKYAQRWREMDDALDEQDTIKNAGEKYLPMTSGMKGTTEGQERYDAYRGRARYYGIVRQILTGMIGLMFEKDPHGSSDEVVTLAGQTNTALARDVARDVASYGRSILVVDAPKTEGVNSPFIVKYHPKDLINWKVDRDNPAEFTLAVLHEVWDDNSGNDEYAHETVDRYRVYRKVEGTVTVTVYNSEEYVVEEERNIGLDTIPVFAIGSISVDPGFDPLPLMPVKDSAIAIYQITADLRQDLYMSGQKQPYQKGISEAQYKANLNSGYGGGSSWYLGNGPDGEAGLIESTGNAYASMAAEREAEIEQAATYAVNMTQTSDAESGRALEIRAAAQYASIYTMADSISIGIRHALNLRAKWAAFQVPEEFAIRTEFTNEDAAYQMITALNNTINSGNAPRSILFEVLRRNDLTDKTDKELESEIETESEQTKPDDDDYLLPGTIRKDNTSQGQTEEQQQKAA